MDIQSPYLSDIEKEKVIAFNKDIVLREAVKKVLLSYIYKNGTLVAGDAAFEPTKNFVFGMASDPNVSDESVGNQLRIAVSGILRVEEAFNQLGRIKENLTEDKGNKKNPAM